MNNTNRGLNRLGIFFFGFVLLVLGAAVATAAAVPDWLEQWKSVSSTVHDGSADVIKNTTLAGLEQSWILIVIAAVSLLLIVLLVVFIFRQGKGHTSTLLSEKVAQGGTDSAAGGSVIIEGKVAAQAIEQALNQHSGLVSSTVGTYSVKGVPTLKITTNVRRGVSPHEVRTFIDETVATWDNVLGREVPVLIQINAGLASRVAKSTRVGTTVVE